MADIFGTDAADSLMATRQGDFLWGLGGNDTLSGLSGNDVFVGGPGFDTVEYSLGRGTISVFSTPVVGVFLVESPPNGFINVGTDILVGVEQIREIFSNLTQNVNLTGLSAPTAPPFGPFWDAVARVAEFNHAETGQWYVAEGPDAQTIHDWDELAAKVQANFEATGHWFL
jgi:hypothetical protein